MFSRIFLIASILLQFASPGSFGQDQTSLPDRQETAELSTDENVTETLPLSPMTTSDVETDPIESSPPGRVVGEVYDEETGKDLVGVAVELDGQVTTTDATGKFRFEDIDPGNHPLTVVDSRYQTVQRTIQIRSGVPTMVRQGMTRRPTDANDEVFEMDRMVVVADLEEDSTADLLIERLESKAIVDIIGKDEFSKMAAGDVGAIVKAQAGVNVVDGRYAVIRGLGDRYSNTTMNGALIPSADPSKKAIQLDLIPSHLVESLLTYKTFTPNLSAEFAGGTVDIRTLRFPEERIISVKGGFGYSANATGEEILLNADRRMDFWGQTGDDLPFGLSPRDFPRGERRSTDPISDEQLQADDIWTRLHRNGSMHPKRQRADWNTGLDMMLGNTWETERFGKFGAVAALTQSHSFGYQPNREINRGSINQGFFSPRSSQMREVSSEQVSWGGLLSLNWLPTEDHSIGFSLISNNSGEDQFVFGSKVVNDEDNTIVNPRDGQPGGIEEYLGNTGRVTRSFEDSSYLFRSLDVGQISGSHLFPQWHRLKFDWISSWATAEEDRPDSRHLKSFQIDYADPSLLNPDLGLSASDVDPTRGTIYSAANPLGGNPANSFRQFLNTVDHSAFHKFDLTIPVSEERDDFQFNLQTGYAYNRRKRNVRGRFFKYDLGSDLRRSINNDDQLGVDFLKDFDQASYIDGTNRNGSAIYLTDLTRSGNEIRNIDAFTNIDSGYFMGTAEWKNWRLVGGFRVEDETRGFELVEGLNPAGIVADQDPKESANLFPAAALDYEFNWKGDHKLRLAYGRTIARPTFYEFAPIRTIDQATDEQTRGNPNLTDTIIDNFDFRWEWRPNDRDLLSFSVFRKEMDFPIVTIVGTRAGSKFFRSWRNSEGGLLQGIELEARKTLWENWSITSNFTYIDSEIGPIIPEADDTTAGSASVFEGQPSYIFNLMLGYENDDWGLDANLIYNYTGEILTDVSASSSVPNIFKEAYHSLDFVVSKTFQSGLELKFTATNLLDWEYRKFYEEESLTYDSYKAGRSYSLSASWDF